MRQNARPLTVALTIPFRARGQGGEVLVRYGANDDPRQWGMDHLDLPVKLDVIRGFPVLQAEIAYDGRGYSAMMGWIQVLDIQSLTSGKAFHLLDRFSAFDETDSPFNTFGHLPTLFDAPALDALPGSIVTWRADAFLAVLGNAGLTRRVTGLLGFRWGFDVKNQQPSLVPPLPLDASGWSDALPFLTEQCPNWEFAPSFESQYET